jgi:hypothetical protein|tara:strand:- start:2856 stop:3269 length:414 start_codon:yes stop_codon:yes gene_type:complete
VTQRGGGRGSAQAKLRLARTRLASELGHLALSEAALEQVVDAVAARRQKIELTELLLYRGTVEDLRGDAEGGVGCERDGVVSKRDSVRGSCLRSLSHLRGDLQIQLLQTLRRELHHATVAGCEELPDLIVLAWRHGN